MPWIRKYAILIVVFIICSITFGCSVRKSYMLVDDRIFMTEGESAEKLSKAFAATSQGKYTDAISYYNGILTTCSSDAEKYYDDSCKIFSHQRIGELYNNMAIQDKTLWMEALKHFQAALEVARKAGSPLSEAQIQKAIHQLYKNQGLYDEALRTEQEILNISLDIHYDEYNELSKILKNPPPKSILDSMLSIIKPVRLQALASLYFHVGDYRQALKYYDDSLKEIRENSRWNADMKSGYISAAFVNKGQCYLKLKDYASIEEQFKEYETLIKNGNIKNSNVELYSFLLMVPAYIESGQFAKAKALLDRSELYATLHNYHIWSGTVLQGLGKPKEASVHFLNAVINIEKSMQWRKTNKASLERSRNIPVMQGLIPGDLLQPYRKLVATLTELDLKNELIGEEFKSFGKDIKSVIFYFVETMKARTLLNTVAVSRKAAYYLDVPVELRDKEQSYLDEFSLIDLQSQQIPTKGFQYAEELIKRRNALWAESNKLIDVLREKYPRYAVLYYPRPVAAEKLLLKNKEVLLEYALLDDAVYLFVIRQGGISKSFKLPLSRTDIEGKVKNFVDPLVINQPSGFSVSKAHELYKLLLSVAINDIKEDDSIIIIPDGILSALPFESLVVKEGTAYGDSKYLGESFAITYASSATTFSMTRMLNPLEVKKVLFALGNPIYNQNDPRDTIHQKRDEKIPSYAYRGLTIIPKMDKKEGDKVGWEEIIYSPLPETETEVRAIAKLFNIQSEPPDILLGVNASESMLQKTTLGDYRYLHFATHADLPGNVQGIKEPFLLLGQIDNKDGEGFLTLSKVYNLRLNADMVVLSACSTGRGEIIEGEGVANFANAFQIAGARSVVVSLWNVASQETVNYMNIFYTNLKEGKSKTEAMKKARNEIKKNYPNPFYWAPFVIYGEN